MPVVMNHQAQALMLVVVTPHSSSSFSRFIEATPILRPHLEAKVTAVPRQRSARKRIDERFFGASTPTEMCTSTPLSPTTAAVYDHDAVGDLPAHRPASGGSVCGGELAADMFVLLIAAFALVASACRVPLKNAPPGGGETVTQTFYYGPFTLGPGEEAMGSPSSGLPRPTGAFGLKGATFDVVDRNGTPVSVHDVHLHHFVLTSSQRRTSCAPAGASDSSDQAWSAPRSRCPDPIRTS